jgi:hypothetical protein
MPPLNITFSSPAVKNSWISCVVQFFATVPTGNEYHDTFSIATVLIIATAGRAVLCAKLLSETIAREHTEVLHGTQNNIAAATAIPAGRAGFFISLYVQPTNHAVPAVTCLCMNLHLIYECHIKTILSHHPIFRYLSSFASVFLYLPLMTLLSVGC